MSLIYKVENIKNRKIYNKHGLSYETMRLWINRGKVNPNFRNGKRSELLSNTIGWSVDKCPSQ